MTPSRWPIFYCAAVGAMDACTGLLLWAAPVLTLKLMLIPGTPLEPVYIRWIGAFVLASGTLYLYPFLAAGPIPRQSRFHVILEATTLIRACVAAVVLTAIFSRELSPAWLSVAISDASLAAIQAWMIQQKLFRQ